ncbi:MAG: 3-hydroxyacyl-CoA dehydrogenase NAD-binding domain-containing protein [Actinomycetota bacterium]
MSETEFELQRAGNLAIVTIDNGEDSTKPCTFGRHALESLGRTLDDLESQEWAGLVLTGKPQGFAVGADIDQFPNVTPELAREGSRAGHELFLRLRNLPFPTLAAINGAALGGGLEIALHCDHRTIARPVRHVGTPEVFLGLFPAWGGTQLLPRLVGPEAAVKVVVANPLRQNRMLDAQKAFELGLVDEVLDEVEFLEESIAFLRDAPAKRADADLSDTADVVRRARGELLGPARAPRVALDLIEGAAEWSLDQGYRAEEDAIAELLPAPQAQNSIYAFNLVERRQKRGVGVPEAPPRIVEKVGIVGGGLMARQLATLFVKRLEVPVVIRELTDALVEAAVADVHAEVGAKKPFLATLVTGTTGWDGFEDCDLVLEAVVEQLPVKQEVFATLRELAPNAILASNTSSLSLAAMGADVGLHFFNPVAVLPLVEIVRHDDSSDEAVATAWDVCKKLRKRGVVTKDAPGFVVNRVLTRMTSVLMDSLEHGNTVEETDEAIVELGMPMAPSVLLQLVGPRVANHVLETMHEAAPDRFPLSPTLANFADGKDEVVVVGDRRRSSEEITEAVLEALADEIGRLLDEGVVGSAQDVDTCLLLGAGWPFFLGGITPHLDQTGVSERVLGRRLADAGAATPA